MLPLIVTLRPSPIKNTTPGWIVNVSPEGTVQLSVAMYGLPEGDQVPEMLPETRVCAEQMTGVNVAAAAIDILSSLFFM